MSLLQKIHVVLLKSLRKSSCAVSRTFDFFHQSWIAQSLPFLFSTSVVHCRGHSNSKPENKVDPISAETTYHVTKIVFWIKHKYDVLLKLCFWKWPRRHSQVIQLVLQCIEFAGLCLIGLLLETTQTRAFFRLAIHWQHNRSCYNSMY